MPHRFIISIRSNFITKPGPTLDMALAAPDSEVKDQAPLKVMKLSKK